jgi:hypothetical protein
LSFLTFISNDAQYLKKVACGFIFYQRPILFHPEMNIYLKR